MSCYFSSESIYPPVEQNANIKIENLKKIDDFCRKLPDIDDYVLVKLGPYEIMKKATVNYTNIYQRLRKKEELFSIDDMQLIAMPLCQSLYFEELPDIEFNQKYGADERIIVTR